MVDYERFNWLVPGKLAGAPHPDLSDGLANVAPFLKASGIGGIVTLCEEPLVVDPENYGFHYLFVETPNFRPPPDLPLILDFIDAELKQQRAVVVHCFAGIGRTGLVLAAWLLRSDPNLSAQDAISRVRDEYIPDYARLRFPEHSDQATAIEVYAERRRSTSSDRCST